jgi:curli production assembly/transport component CsgG/holdfast attachment protein HfaB
MSAARTLFVMLVSGLLCSCTSQQLYGSKGVKPLFSFPVTNNDTPYTRCLGSLAKLPGEHLPTISVGEVADKTGQREGLAESSIISQGISEMVMSAFYKTGKTRMVERFDLRIPLAENKMTETKMITQANQKAGPVRASDFVVLGALTELNYNILSEGAGLYVHGIGAKGRTVIINVGLDLRMINAQTFDVVYVSSLQKQIYGFEVDANVFSFFGSQLVEFDAGRIKNEPLQLGVRSVVEMAVYQFMTDYLGLPSTPECALEKTDFMNDYLDKRKGL